MVAVDTGRAAVLTISADGGSSSTGGFPGTATSVIEHPGEIGDPCGYPEDCESDACFIIGPFGGVCSECDGSADCKPDPGFGCNSGNPADGTPAVCSTTGAIGESCETPDDCIDGLWHRPDLPAPGGGDRGRWGGVRARVGSVRMSDVD